MLISAEVHLVVEVTVFEQSWYILSHTIKVWLTLRLHYYISLDFHLCMV